MTFEQIGKSAEIKSKIFNLKNNWITKTSKLSELLDGKPLNEILNVLRETFEEFRAEAKGQIPSDDAGVGNVALRLLDSTREFIRSFELIENKMVEEKNIVSFIQVTSDSRDYQMKNKGIKGEESEFSKNYSPSKELNYKNVKKINETNNISYRLVYKEQIESIIQSISNFLGIIDEMFPLFLPKPVPKKEIPINSLSVFQGLLKIMKCVPYV